MSGGADFDAAVSQLGEAAAYWVDRAFVYGLAKPGDRPPYEWARTVVAQLISGDEYEAAGAAQTIAEWFDTESDEWWSSPLGRLVEAEMTPQDDEAATVTTGQAASLLDVSYSRIDHFIQEGRIRRVSKGMLSRADVGSLLAEREVSPRADENGSYPGR